MGLWFEELVPGLRLGCGERTIGGAEIAAFAELSGDRNSLHLDGIAAREGPFGGPVAHGALGIAVATGLLAASGHTRGTLVALTGIEWRFLAPIRPGERVRLELAVESRRELAGRGHGLVTFAAELLAGDGRPVQRGRLIELIRRRDGGGDAPGAGASRSPAAQTSAT
jgi:acyl dehydratase